MKKKEKSKPNNDIKVPNLHEMEFADVIKKLHKTAPISNKEIQRKSKEGI